MRSRIYLISSVLMLMLLASTASADGGGTIFVNTNIGGVVFTLTGAANYTGSGPAWVQSNAPAGSYTIVYSGVPGYDTPSPETKTLPDGGSITFNANYTMPGATGTIQVFTDLPLASFVLTGAGNYSGSGSYWWAPGAPAGTYTITLASVSGYPTPPSQTLVLVPGGSISFIGTYGSAANTGTINVSTDLSAATFTVSGPAIYNGSGMYWSQALAPVGVYTISFGAVAGYPTPPSQTLTLNPGGSITFTGAYGATPTTGTIIVNTNLSAATFTITGPATYSGSGTFWSQANCPAGVYTIIYGAVAGYPTPLSEMLLLHEGGVISFNGTYGAGPATGTINVNTNLPAATFLLTGPASYAGNGMAWLQTNAPAGTYTITYGAVSGYTTPASQVQTLTPGGSLNFNGVYLPVSSSGGTIIVTTDVPAASFTVAGPMVYNGSGTLWVQSNATPGVYIVSFGAVPGYVTPANQTLILPPGGTITFSAYYGVPPGTGRIFVSTNLSAASFTITGAAFYTSTGMFWSQSNCPPGMYTVTFNAFPGYATPPSQTLLLTAGGAITFTGNYGLGPGGTISVSTNLLSATFAISGPAYFTGSGLAWSQGGAPAGSYTITFGPVAGYTTPLSQTLYLTPGGAIAFTAVYTSAAPLDLFVIPSSLSFTYDTGQALPEMQKVSVVPQADAVPFLASAYTGSSWLFVTPGSTTAPAILSVGINPAGLPAGIYSGSIRVTAGANYRVTTIPVTLTVRDPARLIVTPASLAYTYTINGARPAAQDLWVSASGRNVSFTASGTASPWFMVSGSGNTPAKLAISVDPATLAAGSYSAVLVISSAEAINSPQTVSVTLTVISAGRQLADPAVFNAAHRDALLAPCSIASIYGSSLAQSTEIAQRVPLPVTLGSARVTVNGRPAAMFYGSPSQLNLQLPCDLAPGPAQVEVYNGSSSAYTTIQIGSTGPGLFLYESKWAAANNEDGSIHGEDNPAASGRPMAVYFTGQGLLDDWIATGDAAPMNHLMHPIANASVKIAGVQAEVLFIGLTPGTVGLAQVNVRVPDLPPGEYPLVLMVGGRESNVAMICVK